MAREDESGSFADERPMIGRYRKSAIVLFLCVIASLPVLAGDEARTLETLLKELRDNRQAVAEEKRLAAEEERRGRALLVQRQARSDDQKKKAEVAEKELQAQKAAIQELNGKQSKLAALKGKAQDSRRRQAQAVIDLVTRYPLLLRPEEHERFVAVTKGKLSGDQVGASFWNSVLTLSVAAVETELSTRKIAVGDATLTATVLRLGGIGAVWLTEDGSRGGTAYQANSKLTWTESPAKDLALIAEAVKVARREIPAKLVVLPLGKGGGG